MRRCGPWFGKICCCILAIDLLLLHLLAWLRPAADIDVAPDYAAGSQAADQAGAALTSIQDVQQSGAAAVQKVSSRLTAGKRARRRPSAAMPADESVLSQLHNGRSTGCGSHHSRRLWEERQ